MNIYLVTSLFKCAHPFSSTRGKSQPKHESKLRFTLPVNGVPLIKISILQRRDPVSKYLPVYAIAANDRITVDT